MTKLPKIGLKRNELTESKRSFRFLIIQELLKNSAFS